MKNAPIDPLTQGNYSYGIDSNKKKYEVAVPLEDGSAVAELTHDMTIGGFGSNSYIVQSSYHPSLIGNWDAAGGSIPNQRFMIHSGPHIGNSTSFCVFGASDNRTCSKVSKIFIWIR